MEHSHVLDASVPSLHALNPGRGSKRQCVLCHSLKGLALLQAALPQELGCVITMELVISEYLQVLPFLGAESLKVFQDQHPDLTSHGTLSPLLMSWLASDSALDGGWQSEVLRG